MLLLFLADAGLLSPSPLAPGSEGERALGAFSLSLFEDEEVSERGEDGNGGSSLGPLEDLEAFDVLSLEDDDDDEEGV